MTKKPKSKHVVRTATPAYFFGAMKAAAVLQDRRGRPRKMPKLPTSLDDLKARQVPDKSHLRRMPK